MAKGASRMAGLIVCDVDEVVLHFVSAFRAFLESEGFTLNPKSYALTGNVRRRTGEEEPAGQAEVSRLLDRFYAANADRLRPVPGAVETLQALSRTYEIAFLSNIPEVYIDLRNQNLKAIGLDFALTGNRGPKGPAVRALKRASAAERVVFLDDSPRHIRSVRAEVPDAFTIHMIADHRFRALVGKVAEADLMAASWREARPAIEALAARS